jgi:hypothetical protein
VGNGNVLDIVVHKNIRLSNAIVSDILDSDHLQIIFYILDHVRTKNVSAPLEKFTDWERFQSLASNLISPRTEINSGAEADKAECAFTASIASAYRLLTSTYCYVTMDIKSTSCFLSIVVHVEDDCLEVEVCVEMKTVVRVDGGATCGRGIIPG